MAGEQISGAQEFYIVTGSGAGGGPYFYARSKDGGLTWFIDTVRDAATGQAVQSQGSQWPTVYADQALYVVYMKETNFRASSPMKLRFLQGLDRVDGGVDFTHLLGPGAEPAELQITPFATSSSLRDAILL